MDLHPPDAGPMEIPAHNLGTGATAHGDSGLRYKGFIAYNVDDKAVAAALQSELQRFARPWYRLRAMRVFRDETDLVGSPGLWSAIKRELAASAWLILIASPSSARSNWVRREVGWWLRHRSVEQIIIGHAGGQLKWDDKAGDFDWKATDALPPEIRGRYVEKPRVVRLIVRPRGRWAMGRRPRLGDETVAEFASPIQGKPKDELVGEHLRYRGILRVMVTCVAVALTALAAVAVWQGAARVHQSRLAQTQQRVARSRDAVIEAEGLRAGQPLTALRIGLGAYALNPAPQTRDSLLTTAIGDQYLATLSGFKDAIALLAFSPNGRLLATVAHLATSVLLWDVTDPTRPHLLTVIPPHTDAVVGVAFTPDSTTLLSVGQDQRMVFWDLTDPTRPVLVEDVPTPGVVSSMALSADGHVLVTASSGPTAIWDVSVPAQAHVVAALPGEAISRALTFGEDRLLAVAAADGTTLWRLSDPAHPSKAATLPISPRSVQALAFAHHGHTLAIGGAGTVTLWDTTDPTRPSQLPPVNKDGGLGGMALDDGGHLLVLAGLDRTIEVWNIVDHGHEYQEAKFNTPNPVKVMAISPDGLDLATDTDEQAGTLWRLRDAAHPRVVGGIPYDTDNFLGLADQHFAVSPDGRLLAGVAGDGNRVRLWDVTDRTRPVLAATIPVSDAALSPLAFGAGGRILALIQHPIRAHRMVSVVLWLDVTDPRNPRQRGTLPPIDDDVGVFAVSPDDAALVTAGLDSGDLVLWDLNDPAHHRQLASPNGADRLAFSPDGRSLAAATRDRGTVLLWDVSDRARPRQRAMYDVSDSVGALTFSWDGGTLAAVGGAARLWDVTGTGTPSGYPQFGADLSGAAGFSGDGKTLAVLAQNGRVLLFDVADREHPALQASILGQEGDVGQVAFVNDQTLLATQFGGVASLWDVADVVAAISDPVRYACRLAGRGLETWEWPRYFGDQPYRETCPG